MENELTNLDSPFDMVGSQVPNIGIGKQELEELITYFEGKSETPKWLNAFMSDSPERVKMFTHVAIALQLSRIPSLITMLGSVNQRLYSAENLATMDVGELSTASKNISTEIANIQESSRRCLEAIDKVGGSNGKYKELLDTLINSSPAEIENMQEYLRLKSEGKDPVKEVTKEEKSE